jgi:hypothetical protein
MLGDKVATIRKQADTDPSMATPKLQFLRGGLSKLSPNIDLITLFKYAQSHVCLLMDKVWGLDLHHSVQGRLV